MRRRSLDEYVRVYASRERIEDFFLLSSGGVFDEFRAASVRAGFMQF